MDYFLGIDLGTSSVKVLIIDGKGNIVDTEKRNYKIYQSHPNWAEQKPGEWWQSICSAVNDLCKGAKMALKIKSIGITGQMHGAIVLDSKDENIYPCIIWSDRRTTSEVEEINNKLSRKDLYKLGNPVVNGFTAPKLLWLLKHLKRKEISSLLLPKDYIVFKMTGNKVSDYSDASATLLFDVQNKVWSEEVLKKLNIPLSILPSLVSPGSKAGVLRKNAASSLGLKAGTPVIAAGGDAPLSALANGITKSGDISITIGTGGQILTIVDEYKVDPDFRLHTLCHALPNKWYIMGAIASAGYCLQWWRDGFKGERVKFKELDKIASTVPPAASGLIFLPYLNGERSPHLNPYATASLFGLTSKHNDAHVVRAIMEGVGFAVKENLEIMKGMGIHFDQIRMTGGAVNSDFWRKIFATVLNKPIYYTKQERGSAYGAALSAANNFGKFNNLREAYNTVDSELLITEPVRENVDTYNRAYKIYKELYKNNKKLFPKLAKLY